MSPVQALAEALTQIHSLPPLFPVAAAALAYYAYASTSSMRSVSALPSMLLLISGSWFSDADLTCL